MNKLYFFRSLLLVGFLGGVSSSFAGREYDDCCEPACCEQVYDCGDPLNCGAVNFWLRAGIAPTLWNGRGEFSLVSCNALAVPNTISNIVPVFQLPKFKSFFKLPWIIGGQIGYAVTDCLEFFVEANYHKASHKTGGPNGATFVLNNVTVPNDIVNVSLTFLDGYRVTDFYVGARYYWGRCWCDRFAGFIGGKFGLVHHQEVDFNYSISSVNCPSSAALASTTCVPFFLRNNAPGVGLDIGFDYCWGCGWSFMFMAEVVATCGPRGNDNIILTSNCSQLPSLMPSNIIIGGIGTEIFFPITFGLKYSF